MKAQTHGISRLAAILAALGLAGSLAACGGSDYGGSMAAPAASPPVTPVTPPSAVSAYAVKDIVADTSGVATNTDARVKNAWGIAFNPTGFVWVANNGTSTSTLYDGNGLPQSLVVAVPGNPTGIVFNSTKDFKVTQNSVSGAAPFIFVGESGTVSGWSPGVNMTNAVGVVDAGAAGKVYKGLAISAYLGINYIYATDFHNGTIDVYDGTFTKVSLPGGFRDATIPPGYAPFGIQAIASNIYVTYARQDAQAHDDVPGAGIGIVDVFDAGGNFIKQLVKGGALNAPWGLAMAPAGFGTLSGKLLVANFGDGKINAYDPADGSFAGALSKADGTPVVIDGLWGIAFGNGVNSQPVNTLFFTAGPADEAHGLYGRVDLQ
ncbi:TIGR03118 family protein [Undibacterium sp. TJN25]|uniref:TIGR03118 family protein n=1 Tax=Undibacterium sp. TJN25 TaxID=3413056 RepID=UPI003BEFAA6F